jgi:hypothetical protein
MLRCPVILLVACGSSAKSAPDALAIIGSPCFDSSQCASGYCQYQMTVSFDPPMCGTCAAAGAETGSACSSSTDCVQGDACVAGTCVLEASLGQSCDSTNTSAPRCAAQLYCDTTKHTCVAVTNGRCGQTPPDLQFIECVPPRMCTATEGGNFCLMTSGSVATCTPM